MNNKTQTLRVLWLFIAMAGVVGTLMSLAGIGLAFVLPVSDGDITVVVVASIGLAGLLWGLSLMWAGWTGWKQIPSPAFYPRWAWLILLGITLALFVIGAIIPAERHSQPLFAPLHLGLILFPALMLMSWTILAAGRDALPTLRQMLATTFGGAMSIALALPVELLGLLFSGIFAVVIAPMFPGGEAEVMRLTHLLEQWMQMPPTDMDDVLTVVASPVVLVILGLTLSIITPIIEEFGKTLVMGMMGLWQHPSLLQSFLWGAACGLGFALVEGITNGALGLGEVMGWLGGAGSRVLATAMHMLTGGVVGLGWGLLWHKRWWALPLTYVGAVLFHGLWNLNVILSIGGTGIGEATSPMGYVLVVIGAGMQLVLILLTPIGLIGIPLWLRRREKKGIALAFVE